MSLTDLDISRQMRRLAAIYRAPDDRDAAIAVWRDVLDDVSPTELMGAVGRYLSEDNTYFPKPGKLRQMVVQQRVGYTGRQRTNGTDPSVECPACGEKLRILSPEEQVLWMWDADEGRRTQRLLEASGKRLGILHDLGVSHAGLPVSYGRFVPDSTARKARTSPQDGAE